MVGGFAGFIAFSFIAPLGRAGLVRRALLMVLAMLAVGFLGVLIERVAYAPMLSAPRLSILITALAVSLVLQNGVLTLTKGQYTPSARRSASAASISARCSSATTR
jgi:branched-chain amino acid transport system permease protein